MNDDSLIGLKLLTLYLKLKRALATAYYLAVLVPLFITTFSGLTFLAIVYPSTALDGTHNRLAQ